jgi:DNA-binding HxlR family transcriptional regulator
MMWWERLFLYGVTAAALTYGVRYLAGKFADYLEDKQNTVVFELLLQAQRPLTRGEMMERAGRRLNQHMLPKVLDIMVKMHLVTETERGDTFEYALTGRGKSLASRWKP